MTTAADTLSALDAAFEAWMAASNRVEDALYSVDVVNDDSPEAIAYRDAVAASDIAKAAYLAAKAAHAAAVDAVECGSRDHDGYFAPATRRVTAGTEDSVTVDEMRCAVCAEGLVARLLRDGLRVTIEPINTPS